jgi:hypothetical protein
VQYRRGQTGASRFPGHGEFRGETRPIGAIINVVVNGEDVPHPDEDTERARKAAARAAASAEARATEEEKEDDLGPTVELRVEDAGGVVIRTWEEYVHKGLNRIAWDLRRDAFASPDTVQEESARARFRPGGILVLPGSYTVTASFEGEERSARVTVLPDPREPATADDRRQKYESLLAAGALRDSLADAITLIYHLRTDIETVLTLEQRAHEDRPDGDQGDAGGEADGELEAMAEDIRRALTEIEEHIWVPEGTKGIVYSADRAWNMLGYALGALQSSWDAPTAAQLAYVARAESAAAEVLNDLATLHSGDVADFRRAVRAAGLSLMPEADVPRVP